MQSFRDAMIGCFIWTDEIDTIGVASKQIFCNRAWWDTLTKEQQDVYLNHELSHIVIMTGRL